MTNFLVYLIVKSYTRYLILINILFCCFVLCFVALFVVVTVDNDDDVAVHYDIHTATGKLLLSNRILNSCDICPFDLSCARDWFHIR